MEGKELGVVLGATQALDPFRRLAVLVRTLCARDLPVGDVSQQHVGERPFALAPNRGASLPGQEALAFEGVQQRVGRMLVSAKRSGPEDLADHRRVLEDRLFLGREAVEARGDDPLERLGERHVFRGAALEVELCELLCVQRVALRAIQQRLLDLGRQNAAREDLRDQDRGLLRGEGSEPDHRGVQRSAAPARAALEQLRPRAADDEERDAAQPIDELVDEVEQALVGPVQVLEHEHERPLVGECFEEASPSGEGLAATVAAQAGSRLETDERTKVRLDPGGVLLVGDGCGDGSLELFRHRVLAVFVMNACLRLDHLCERPEGDAVSVREAAPLTPGDQLGVGVDDPRQLVHEAALAHPRHGDEGDELRDPLVAGAFERVAEHRELTVAADELDECVMRDVDTEARAGRNHLPDPNRLRFALRVDRGCVAILDRPACRAVGRLVGEDAVDRGCALEARACVDDVARRHPLALGRARVECDQRLTGRDPDPKLEPVLHREVANCERGADRALGIVLVSGGCSEQRHDRVADELLDRSPMALELDAQARVVRAEYGTNVLGVELLRRRREPDQVAEEDGDDLPLLTRGRRRHGER